MLVASASCLLAGVGMLTIQGGFISFAIAEFGPFLAFAACAFAYIARRADGPLRPLAICMLWAGIVGALPLLLIAPELFLLHRLGAAFNPPADLDGVLAGAIAAALAAGLALGALVTALRARWGHNHGWPVAAAVAVLAASCLFFATWHGKRARLIEFTKSPATPFGTVLHMATTLRREIEACIGTGSTTPAGCAMQVAPRLQQQAGFELIRRAYGLDITSSVVPAGDGVSFLVRTDAADGLIAFGATWTATGQLSTTCSPAGRYACDARGHW